MIIEGDQRELNINLMDDNSQDFTSPVNHFCEMDSPNQSYALANFQKAFLQESFRISQGIQNMPQQKFFRPDHQHPKELATHRNQLTPQIQQHFIPTKSTNTIRTQSLPPLESPAKSKSVLYNQSEIYTSENNQQIDNNFFKVDLQQQPLTKEYINNLVLNSRINLYQSSITDQRINLHQQNNQLKWQSSQSKFSINNDINGRSFILAPKNTIQPKSNNSKKSKTKIFEDICARVSSHSVVQNSKINKTKNFFAVMNQQVIKGSRTLPFEQQTQAEIEFNNGNTVQELQKNTLISALKSNPAKNQLKLHTEPNNPHCLTNNDNATSFRNLMEPTFVLNHNRNVQKAQSTQNENFSKNRENTLNLQYTSTNISKFNQVGLGHQQIEFKHHSAMDQMPQIQMVGQTQDQQLENEMVFRSRSSNQLQKSAKTLQFQKMIHHQVQVPILASTEENGTNNQIGAGVQLGYPSSPSGLHNHAQERESFQEGNIQDHMNKNNNSNSRRRPNSYNEQSRLNYVASQGSSTNIEGTADTVPVGGELLTENTVRNGMLELQQPSSSRPVQLSVVTSAGNNSNLGIRNVSNQFQSQNQVFNNYNVLPYQQSYPPSHGQHLIPTINNNQLKPNQQLLPALVFNYSDQAIANQSNNQPSYYSQNNHQQMLNTQNGTTYSLSNNNYIFSQNRGVLNHQTHVTPQQPLYNIATGTQPQLQKVSVLQQQQMAQMQQQLNQQNSNYNTRYSQVLYSQPNQVQQQRSGPNQNPGTSYEASQQQTMGNQSNNTNATTNVTEQLQQQVLPKIPVICGFHKQMLLLTCQYFTSQATHQSQLGNAPSLSSQQQIGIIGGVSVGGMPTQAQIQNQMRRIRNKNPNCNHNSTSVFYQPHYNNVKYDDTHQKKEDVLRKVFFKESAKMEDERKSTTGNTIGGPSAIGAAGAQIVARPASKNDPLTHLRIIDHILAESMYIKDIMANNSKSLSSTQSLLLELELDRMHSAHKAFLLALIRSGKVNIENLQKVLQEVKLTGHMVDTECIYCKYSQFALKESAKVGLLQHQAQIQQQLQAQQNEQQISSQELAIQQQLLQSQNPQLTHELRIEHLVKMFQTQLFKKSFITTSLLIIQRRMNDKMYVRTSKSRDSRDNISNPNQNNLVNPQNVLGQQMGPNGALVKRPDRKDNFKKKEQKPNLNTFEGLTAQIQKLSKNLANPKDKDKYLELKERHYREFLMKINRSNNYDLKFPTASFPPYKYYIGRGNNSILIRAALKTRFWWSMGDFEEWSDYNFMWTQWKSNKILDCIKSHKDFIKDQKEQDEKKEGDVSTQATDNQSCSSSENLINTPKRQARNQALAAVLKKQHDSTLTSSGQKDQPTTTVVDKKPSAPLIQTPFRSGLNDFNKASIKKKDDDTKEENLTSHSSTTTNHQENNFHLSNKKAIYYNMKIYYDATKQNIFDYLPLTFHIKDGVTDREFQKFEESYNNPQDHPDLAKYPNMGQHIWIVKPGENTNRGCGITVCRELSQIKTIVSMTHVNGKKRSYIIQKYCEKPLLYKQRKFDIRCYAVTQTVNGNLQGYYYTDGYLRTSCREYNIKNVTNRLIHLTNDAVQKKCDDYGKFENGNKLSYTEFQKYLDTTGIKVDFAKEVLPQFKTLVADTIKAVSRKLDPQRRQFSFEIFGYDFMLDEDLKPWLIEVNTNPCLELSSPYLARLIPAMIENAIKIVVDPIYPPPPVPIQKRHQIPDAIENKFELVFNERDDGPELKNLPIDDNMNGIIDEEEMEDEGSDEEVEVDAGDDR